MFFNSIFIIKYQTSSKILNFKNSGEFEISVGDIGIFFVGYIDLVTNVGDKFEILLTDSGCW